MVKKLILFLIIFTLLVIPAYLFSQETQSQVENKVKNNPGTGIVSVNDIKKLMSDKFKSIKDYTADFEWINGNAHYKGKIQYKKPDKILLDFDEPKDQKIISDGKTLYVYIPYLKVVVKQTLGEGTESQILTNQSEKGLNKLFDEYAFSFYDKSNLQKFGDTMAYHLKLFQKKPKVGFKRMDLWISKDDLILQSNGVSMNGQNISLTFSNIKLNTEIPDYIFNFKIPVNAQVIRNIIVPFSEK